MKDLETMQREGREKVYKDIIYWVMNPSAREAIFTPKEANDVIDQHTANTWKACKDAILESGLLEEKDVSGEFLCDLVYRMPPQDGDTVTHTHVDYSARIGHNTLARAVKEFMSNIDTNSVDSIHLNKQAN